MSNEERSPCPGDIWRECEHGRFVLVISVSANAVTIYTVRQNADGVWMPEVRALAKQAKLSRFNGKGNGYYLYHRPRALLRSAS